MNTNYKKLISISVCSLFLLSNAQGVAGRTMDDTILEYCKDISIDPAQRIGLVIRTGKTFSREEIRCADKLRNRQAINDSDENYLNNKIIDPTFRVDAAHSFVDQKSMAITENLNKKQIEVYFSTADSTDSKKNDIETVQGFWSIKKGK